MKNIKATITTTLIALAISTAFFGFSNHGKKVHEINPSHNGFAVLELFTSEGCSSCPPADELMAHIQKEAGDKPVYVLSYHVDYWDRLGWKDVFSDASFTKRQYRYSEQLASEVYTPQVVINGRSETIGSYAGVIKAKVDEALKTTSQAHLKVYGSLQPGMLKLEYSVTGRQNDDQLVLAIVQKQAFTDVKRGENGGRRLSHAQIVRKLLKYDIAQAGNGSTSLKLPPQFNAADWEIIAMVQQPGSGVITAATRVNFLPQ